MSENPRMSLAESFQERMNVKDMNSDWVSCLSIFEGLARMTYKSFCIKDYTHGRFLYVSNNTESFCGRTSNEIMTMGYDFYQNHIEEEDLKVMNIAYEASLEFLQNVPVEERYLYVLSYDFNILNSSTNTESLINHQYTPLKFSDDGKLELSLCLASLSSHHKSGIIEMLNTKTKEYWVYNLEARYWRKRPKVLLKKEEKTVIKLSAQGYSISDMAEYMNKSFDTIKFYRKSLFRKLEVESITEAVSHAVSKKLL